MNDLEENVHHKVRRLEDDIDKLVKRYAVAVVKYSFLSFVFGIALGAFGMVYFEQPKDKPVAKVEREITGAVSEANKLYATPLTTPLTDQRVKELRFSLQKLERLKDVHDATLKEAATNQGDIREMVKALEVGE